jgi:hypothetical protein
LLLPDGSQTIEINVINLRNSIWISVFVSKTKKNKMADIIEEFNEYRSRMNEKLLADNNKIVKRIFPRH